MRGPTISFADSVFSKYIFTAADVMNVGFFCFAPKNELLKNTTKGLKKLRHIHQ